MSQVTPDRPLVETVAALASQIEALQARVAALESRLPQGAAQPRVEAVAVASAAVPQPVDPLGQIKALLENLFALAAATTVEDSEAFDVRFEAFKALVHGDRQGSPLLDTDLRRYKFIPFVGRFADYLEHRDAPGSFQLERTMPAQIDARTETVKLHVLVRHGRRMSPPVSLRRDPRADGAFRIEQMSL
jgi:hypothetical protein